MKSLRLLAQKLRLHQLKSRLRTASQRWHYRLFSIFLRKILFDDVIVCYVMSSGATSVRTEKSRTAILTKIKWSSFTLCVESFLTCFPLLAFVLDAGDDLYHISCLHTVLDRLNSSTEWSTDSSCWISWLARCWSWTVHSWTSPTPWRAMSSGSKVGRILFKFLFFKRSASKYSGIRWTVVTSYSQGLLS